MTWAPPALPPRLFYAIPVGAARRRASFMPGRSGFLLGVAMQAVGMGSQLGQQLEKLSPIGALKGDRRQVILWRIRQQTVQPFNTRAEILNIHS